MANETYARAIRPSDVQDINGKQIWDQNVLRLSRSGQKTYIGVMCFDHLANAFVIRTSLDSEDDGVDVEISEFQRLGYAFEIIGSISKLADLLA